MGQADQPRVSRRRHRASTRARREAILEAAIKLVAEQGVSAVTHRSVTEAAGVPIATVGYFFESIDDLADEAVQVFTERRVQQFTEFTKSFEATQLTPDGLAQLMSQIPLSDQALAVAMVEIYLYGYRKPESTHLASRILEAFCSTSEAAMRAVGAPHPHTNAEAFVALVDGFALHSVIGTDQEMSREKLYRAWRALYLGNLVEAGQTDSAVRLVAEFPLPDGN